ncbi:hypothetical protein [Mucisphaera sp.]|uniref:hypothetical protein n=1 Tax=Mucisphaera sp. TaxID=2913024 RepID=UPI003D12BD60
MKTALTTTALLAVTLTAASAPAAELLTNANFDGPPVGDGWGSFGAAGFHSFFGPNGHASLFSDNPGNFGGVFQTGIAGTPGVEYQFDLLDVRLEENIDANYRFGLEYYQADDATKIGENIVPIDLSVTGDGLSFSMTGTAVPGTVFIRPIILFDNVVSTANGQENAFIFDSSLTVVPTPSAFGAMALLGGMILRRRAIG